jgi:4-amino-4-deoxy-L-arabinose transferase-like glycosyltransferase
MGELLGLGLFFYWGVLALVKTFIVLIVPIVVSIIARWRKLKKPWLWGLSTFLAICIFQTWDVLLTPFVAEKYCKTEAGSWVNKFLWKWEGEDPEIKNGSRTAANYRFYESRLWLGGSQELQNGRLVVEVKRTEPNPRFPFVVFEEQYIDVKKRNVLARRVWVVSGDSPSDFISDTNKPPLSLRPFVLRAIHSVCVNESAEWKVFKGSV